MNYPTEESYETLRPVVSRMILLSYPDLNGTPLEHFVNCIMRSCVEKFHEQTIITCTKEIDKLLDVWTKRFGLEDAYIKLLTADGTMPRMYPEPGISDTLDQMLVWITETI